METEPVAAVSLELEKVGVTKLSTPLLTVHNGGPTFCGLLVDLDEALLHRTGFSVELADAGDLPVRHRHQGRRQLGQGVGSFIGRHVAG